MKKMGRSVICLTLIVWLAAAAFCLSGCETEKQYPGGDNDDSRKAAPAATASSAPAAAAPSAAPARDKAGSGEAGGK